jgi:hypothetical protein
MPFPELIGPTAQPLTSEILVVVNWFDELAKLVQRERRD